MSCDHPNDADMEGYVMSRIDGDTWGVRHSNGCNGNVVRNGLNDALFWIEIHEHICEKRAS